MLSIAIGEGLFWNDGVGASLTIFQSHALSVGFRREQPINPKSDSDLHD
jgi:hypothetical protein